MKLNPNKLYYSVKEVADYFGVTPNTIQNYIDKGYLKCVKLLGAKRISTQHILGMLEHFQNDEDTIAFIKKQTEKKDSFANR